MCWGRICLFMYLFIYLFIFKYPAFLPISIIIEDVDVSPPGKELQSTTSFSAQTHSFQSCLDWDRPCMITGPISCNGRQPWPCNCFPLMMWSGKSEKSVVRIKAPKKAIFQSQVIWWPGEFICPELWVLIYLPLLNILNTTEWFLSNNFNSAGKLLNKIHTLLLPAGWRKTGFEVSSVLRTCSGLFRFYHIRWYGQLHYLGW